MASNSPKAANGNEIDRLAFVLAKEPGSKAFIPLAEEYGKAGMWQEAAAVLEDGLKAFPNFVIAMVALGRTYDQLDQPAKAKALLEEAIKLSPENLRAHRTLAKIYVADREVEAGLRSCAVILSLNPQDQEALSLRAALMGLETTTSVPDAAPLTASGGMAKTEAQTPTVEASPSAPVPIRHAAHVRRLEQWLAAIQLRRRCTGSVPTLS